MGPAANRRDAREFTLTVENGMSALQPIQAATAAAADPPGVSQDLGSVRIGKIADLIAVRGDLISAVKVLEHVSFDMKQGVVFRNEAGAT